MRKLIEKVIARLKGDPSYRLDGTYTMRQLFQIVYYRAGQILRGFFIKYRLASSSGLIFCGRRVIVQHAYQFHAGRSLIIEDSVHINALSSKGIVVGDNVTIGKQAILVCTGVIAHKGEGIRMGNSSSIGAQSFISGQGGIEIGNDVIMGPQVKIFSENHNFNLSNIPIRKQGESRKGVRIGDNCWIVAGVTILDGVTIGSGCVIAAGAVVTESISSNSLAGGIPARVLRPRVV